MKENERLIEGNLPDLFKEPVLPKNSNQRLSELSRTLENLRIRFEIRRKR